MTNIKIIPTTAEHMVAMTGANPPLTIKAITAIRDGKVLGVAGVCRVGMCWVLFSELTDEFLKNKRAMVKGVKEIRRMVNSLTLPVIAIPESEKPSLIEHIEGVQRWPS